MSRVPVLGERVTFETPDDDEPPYATTKNRFFVSRVEWVSYLPDWREKIVDEEMQARVTLRRVPKKELEDG